MGADLGICTPARSITIYIGIKSYYRLNQKYEILLPVKTALFSKMISKVIWMVILENLKEIFPIMHSFPISPIQDIIVLA
jgi:hypothetical protein